MNTHKESAGKAREQWGSQLGFLMAAIGSAIGLGNIWRFPGVAYTNGGGAFMIPYVIALLFAGIPILLLEYGLGHRFRGSAPAVFRRVSKRWEFIGWWQAAVNFFIMTYYAVIIAWAIRYVFYSVTKAWGDSPDGAKNFFFGSFTHVAEADGFSATPVWNIALPLAVVWIIVLGAIARGVSRGVELINRICLPLLVVLFLALVIRALTLPGAAEGLNALWTPDFNALSKPSVWIGAFAQIFFSLSVGFGIMLTYASYLKPKSNLVGTGLVAAFANSSFEILAGFGVFATLGYMAHQQGIGVSELDGLTGPSLSFVTFPTVITHMPGGAVFGILFFVSLALAGITSLISVVQVVAAGIQEKFDVSPARAAMYVGVPAALISLFIFSSKSGLLSLDVVDAYVNQIMIVSGAIMECFLCTVVVKQLPVIQRHLNVTSGSGNFVGAWWRYLVGLVVPVVLLYLFASTFYTYLVHQYSADYTRGFEGVFGWGVVLVSALLTFILTKIPWRTPVDEFTPIALPDRGRTHRSRTEARS